MFRADLIAFVITIWSWINRMKMNNAQSAMKPATMEASMLRVPAPRGGQAAAGLELPRIVAKWP